MKTVQKFDPASSFKRPRKVVLDFVVGCREKEIKKNGVVVRRVPSVAERLLNAGIPRQWSTPDQEGPKSAPAGIPVFGKSGGTDVSFVNVVADLEARGLVLAYMNVISRIKNGSFDRTSLHFVFIPAGEVKEPFRIPEPAQKLVEEVLKRTFEYVHAFRNPDGSEVVLGLASGDQAPLTALRFDISGDIVLEEVPPRPPKAEKPSKAQASASAPAQEQPPS